MGLEDIDELEALGKVVTVGDSNGGYILTVHVTEDKRGIAPMVAANYFGFRNIPIDEFSYKSGELKVKYREFKPE